MEDYRLVSDHLPPGAWVLFFTGREAISELFRFEVILAMTAAQSLAFDMDDAHRRQATLTISAPDASLAVSYCGVISAIEHVNEFAEHGIYAVTLEPIQSDCQRSVRSAVFTSEHDRTALPHLLEQHLASVCGYDAKEGYYRVGLVRPGYAERPHVCQYNESDYAFLSRVCEREGAYFYFAPPNTLAGEAPFDIMMFTDDKAHHQAWRRSPVRFFPGASTAGAQVEAFEFFRARSASVEARFGERDYNDATTAVVHGEAQTASARGAGVSTRWGANFDSDDRGRRLASDRADEANTRFKVLKGRGRVFGVRSGYLFRLVDHPRPALNTSYLAVEVEHRCNRLSEIPALAKVLGMEVSDRAYEVEVTAIPATQRYMPPRRTPVPRIYGVETATVDGATDDREVAQLDAQGRYKVRVHFDQREGVPDGKRSMWVRMMQPHAGAGYGQHFPLKKGAEVLLVFLGGDPDRPVIAGGVSSPSAHSPVTGENPTQGVLATRGGNALVMEDARGHEWVHLSSPNQRSLLHLGASHALPGATKPNDNHAHNWELRTEGSGRLCTGGDHDLSVGGTQYVRIAGDKTTVVNGERWDRVGGNEHRWVEHDLQLTAGSYKIFTDTMYVGAKSTDQHHDDFNIQVGIAMEGFVLQVGRKAIELELVGLYAGVYGAKFELVGVHLSAGLYVKTGISVFT